MTSQELPSAADVVIVGAGPAGLAAAVTLAQRHVGVLVLDRLAEGNNTSRACVVHARTLEVFDELGLFDAVAERGLIVPLFSVRERDRTLISLNFDTLPTKFPYTIMIPQSDTEAVLMQRLRELGVPVHRGYEVAGVSADATGATVTAKSPDGEEITVHGRYVIGADGMHSVVREQLGIGFVGGTYAASFVLADVRMDWPVRRDEVTLFYSPEGLTVVAALPGDHFRIVATVDEAPEHPTADYIEALLDARGPAGGAHVHEVIWGSRFRVHHRVVDAYRKGSVFLAGDAAHVHSPAGGQGMNTGIQDAVYLSRLLADVIEGADPATLDRYEEVRRPIAMRVVAFTDRMTRMATMHSGFGRFGRNILMSIVGHVPPLRRKLMMALSELNNR